MHGKNAKVGLENVPAKKNVGETYDSQKFSISNIRGLKYTLAL